MPISAPMIATAIMTTAAMVALPYLPALKMKKKFEKKTDFVKLALTSLGSTFDKLNKREKEAYF